MFTLTLHFLNTTITSLIKKIILSNSTRVTLRHLHLPQYKGSTRKISLKISKATPSPPTDGVCVASSICVAEAPPFKHCGDLSSGLNWAGWDFQARTPKRAFKDHDLTVYAKGRISVSPACAERCGIAFVFVCVQRHGSNKRGMWDLQNAQQRWKKI